MWQEGFSAFYNSHRCHEVPRGEASYFSLCTLYFRPHDLEVNFETNLDAIWMQTWLERTLHRRLDGFSLDSLVSDFVTTRIRKAGRKETSAQNQTWSSIISSTIPFQLLLSCLCIGFLIYHDKSGDCLLPLLYCIWFWGSPIPTSKYGRIWMIS